MKIKITDATLLQIPSLNIGIIKVTGLQNRIDDRTIPVLLQAEEAKIRSLGSATFQTNESSTKIDSKLYIHKLFETILSGKDIQRFNPLRDLCALTELRFKHPVFPITLEPGDTDIIFELSPSERKLTHGSSRKSSELICTNASGRIFDLIEGTTAVSVAVIPQTEAALVFLVSTAANSVEQIQTAKREISGSISKLLSGKCETYEINQAQSEVELEPL